MAILVLSVAESAEIWRTRASKKQQEGTSNALSALCKADIPNETLDVIRQVMISAGLVVDDPNDISIETGVIAVTGLPVEESTREETPPCMEA